MLSDTSVIPSAHEVVFERTPLACLYMRDVSFVNVALVWMVSCSHVPALHYKKHIGVSVRVCPQ